MLALSIIVPVYSGQNYLPALIDQIVELKALWENGDMPIRVKEVILVDDNAIDGSSGLIDELAATSEWVVALHLSRNFGQHPATIAGILHSSGDWIITMDEDLQHPPARIPELLTEAVTRHSDVVYGKPVSRVHENLLRDLTSRLSKRMIEWLSGNPMITKANSFRLIRGPIARAAASVCGHDTYFDVSLSWFTQRVEVLAMELKDQRFIATGKSGYRLKSLLSHGRRLVFSGQLKALRLAALGGFAIAGLSALGGAGVVLSKLFLPDLIVAKGWASLIIAICFFSGVIMILLGIILEYLSILVLRAHGKPLFFTINRSSDAKLLPYFGSKS